MNTLLHTLSAPLRRGLVLATAAVAFASALAPAPAVAGPVMDRVTKSSTVRVCIWPDYYGISFRNPRTSHSRLLAVIAPSGFEQFFAAVDALPSAGAPDMTQQRECGA